MKNTYIKFRLKLASSLLAYKGLKVVIVNARQSSQNISADVGRTFQPQNGQIVSVGTRLVERMNVNIGDVDLLKVLRLVVVKANQLSML